MSNKKFEDLKEGFDYNIISKMINRKGKWRKIPEGVNDYGKQLDEILDKIICP